MNPLETYLRELRDIHSTWPAIPETFFYGRVKRLLNEIGNPNNASLGTKWDNWPATFVFDTSASQVSIHSKCTVSATIRIHRLKW